MSDRTGRTKLLLAVGAVCIYLLPAGGAAPVATAAPEPAGTGSSDGEGNRTIVFLVRHAEKTGDMQEDPLSEAGIKRAEALARLLSAAGVTHLYSTQYQRARQTLVQLATDLGLEVEEFEALKPEQQVAVIRDLPAGSVAVVAGHTNTIPQIANLLGGEISDLVDGPAGPMIRHETYDRLFLVILPRAGGDSPSGRAQTVELRYGD